MQKRVVSRLRVTGERKRGDCSSPPSLSLPAVIPIEIWVERGRAARKTRISKKNKITSHQTNMHEGNFQIAVPWGLASGSLTSEGSETLPGQGFVRWPPLFLLLSPPHTAEALLLLGVSRKGTAVWTRLALAVSASLPFFDDASLGKGTKLAARYRDIDPFPSLYSKVVIATSNGDLRFAIGIYAVAPHRNDVW